MVREKSNTRYCGLDIKIDRITLVAVLIGVGICGILEG